MKDSLEIKWPWEMIDLGYVDAMIDQIKSALPPDHELQKHILFPGIKWHRRRVFIVTNDTTGQHILMNFEKMNRWKKTKYKIPTITVYEEISEIAELIERDHMTECKKHNEEGSL